MKPSEILRAAAFKLDTLDAWTQDAYARNAEGDKTGPSGKDATCWCMRGALYAVSGPDPDGSLEVAIDLLNKVVNDLGHTAFEFNDRFATQSMVVQALHDAADAGERVGA